MQQRKVGQWETNDRMTLIPLLPSSSSSSSTPTPASPLLPKAEWGRKRGSEEGEGLTCRMDGDQAFSRIRKRGEERRERWIKSFPLSLVNWMLLDGGQQTENRIISAK